MLLRSSYLIGVGVFGLASLSVRRREHAVWWPGVLPQASRWAAFSGTRLRADQLDLASRPDRGSAVSAMCGVATLVGPATGGPFRAARAVAMGVRRDSVADRVDSHVDCRSRFRCRKSARRRDASGQHTRCQSGASYRPMGAAAQRQHPNYLVQDGQDLAAAALLRSCGVVLCDRPGGPRSGVAASVFGSDPLRNGYRPCAVRMIARPVVRYLHCRCLVSDWCRGPGGSRVLGIAALAAPAGRSVRSPALVNKIAVHRACRVAKRARAGDGVGVGIGAVTQRASGDHRAGRGRLALRSSGSGSPGL